MNFCSSASSLTTRTAPVTESSSDEEKRQLLISEIKKKLRGSLADEHGNLPKGSDRPIAIEVDGPSHFYVNTTKYTAYTKLKHRLLTRMGYRVLHVPYFEWRKLRGAKERENYMKAKLAEEPSEWLDPVDEKYYREGLERQTSDESVSSPKTPPPPSTPRPTRSYFMPSTTSLGSRRNESSPSSHRSHRHNRPLSSRPYQPSTARSVNIIDNLDEILTQRSQVSMSQYNDSGDDSGGGLTIRRRSSSRLDRSVTPPSSTNRRSVDQVALVGTNRTAIPRRHSINAVRRKNSYSSDSSSSLDGGGVLDNRRPASRRSLATSVAPIQASVHPDKDDEEDKRSDSSPGGFFSCMRCFKSSTSVDRRSVIVSPPPTLPTVFRNRYCHFTHKYLTMMSENLEADVLSNSSHFDSRLVFILYSLLSGDSLLTPQEFPDCDEWCDWLSLGFSDSSIEAFDRDINRNGCQTMGLLFQLFFAIQYPQIAKMCVIVIRNIHFTPSPLFGLFSVNCAKWTRDVLLSTFARYDDRSPLKIPPLIDSAKFSFASYKQFTEVFDWWMSHGQSGSIDHIESKLMDEADHHGAGGARLYESFPDDEDEDNDTMPPSYRASSSPNRRVSFQPPFSRLPGIDRRSGDSELIKSVFSVGGLYYTYCILFFTKFWLEQKLIEVDPDTARDRLNNQYLETWFVAKLELSSSMSVVDVEKRIEKLIERIQNLWESCGWTKERLLAN